MSIGKSKFRCKGPIKPLGLPLWVRQWAHGRCKGFSRRDQAIRT